VNWIQSNQLIANRAGNRVRQAENAASGRNGPWAWAQARQERLGGCPGFSPGSMEIQGEPADLIFAHEVGGVWQDITSSNDLQNQIICGVTDSFSYFALMEVSDPVQLLNELIADVATLNAKNGIINALDKKLETAQDALQQARANNDLSAINTLMNAFINHVEAQRGKEITIAEGDYLIEHATEIVLVIAGAVSI